MATIINHGAKNLLYSPSVSPLDVTPLVVTPVVTDDPVSHLIENDLSLAAATGDPTLRPLSDYLANAVDISVSNTAPVTAIPVFSEATNDALTSWGYISTTPGGHPTTPWAVEAIIGRPLGCGTSGVSTDSGLTVSMIKQGWTGPSSVIGEVDGINVVVRNGGPDVHTGVTSLSSDCSAFVGNIANIGNSGFAVGAEFVVGNVNTSFALTAEVDVQVGSIYSTIESQVGYGLVATALVGTLSDGIRIQVGGSGGAWTNFIHCQGSSGALKFNITYAGLTYSALGFQADLKTPASATATGIQGQIAWDANFIYVCTATNTWKRVAIATW